MSLYDTFKASQSGGTSLYDQFLKSQEPKPTFGESVLKTMPGTVNTLADLQIDPLALKANPTETAKNAVTSLFQSYKPLQQDIHDLFSSNSASSAIGNVAKTVSGAANVVFSPISALFQASKGIPFLGSVARLIELPFVTTGDIAPHVSNTVIDHLPISDQAKQNLKPGIGELLTLAGQLALGKLGEIGTEKIAELTKKYGVEDAQTIATEAQRIAEERKVNVRATPEPSLFERYQTDISTKPTETIDLRSPQVPFQDIVPSEVKPTTIKSTEIPTPTVSEPKVSIPIEAPKPESPLLQEARKYKSAEEFVKAQPTYYHGTNNAQAIEKGGFSISPEVQKGSDFLGDNFVEGVHLSDSRKPYQYGGQLEDVASVLKVSTDAKNILKTDLNGIGKLYEKYGIREGDAGYAQKLTDALKKDGYDGIKYGDETVIFDPSKVKTKSQLTSIWEKAQKTQPIAVEKPVVKPKLPEVKGTGPLQPRGLSVGVEAGAIEKGLTDSLGQLPEYRSINMKDQAARATDLLTTDYEKAKDIAMGRKTSPKGLLPEAVFKAVEQKALAESDVNTLRDLATQSGLASQATTMGQRIKALDNQDPNSPIGAIKDIIKAREQQIKDVAKAKSAETSKIDSEIKKSLPTKQTWSEFIDSLEC